MAEARSQIKALPARAIAPFGPANMVDFSDLQECASWPFSSPAPPPARAPLPNVPTLILSGANDLRTPTANAQEVAAQIPDSQLLVVPYTGHAVLDGEPTSCGRDALEAMFAGHPIKPCVAAPPPLTLRPPPLPPLQLAQVPPAKGNAGKPGRTLEAVLLTLHDFGHQLTFALGQSGGASLTAFPTLRRGGLRSGWGQFEGRAETLHAYSFVPGVTVSGKLTSASIGLRIGGGAAAHGTLHEGPHNSLVGMLGGHRVHILPTASASTAILGADAPSHHLGPGGSATRVSARELAGALGWLLGA
jgi:hypothetical protein